MIPVILGVDPGLHGALAVYSPEVKGCSGPSDTAGLATVYDMPITKDGSIDIPALSMLVKRFAWPSTTAVVENVHSRPRQAGAFSFGLYTGIVHGVLGAYGIPTALITPTEWKRAMGLTRGEDESKADTKDRARALATQLFPTLTEQFNRKKDDGRAEALLLALYYHHKRK